MLAGDQNHVAAATAVAAAGTAARDKFLAPERKAAIAAVAGFHLDSYFIDKHIGRGSGKQRALREAAAERELARLNADEFAEAAAVAKLDDAGDLGKQGIVLAAADILAGLDTACRAAGREWTRQSPFPAEGLHAQPLGIGIAPVFGTA